MRLKKDQDIKRVFAKGKSVHDDALGIKFAPNGRPESRFAVVVGTKTAKTAVARNRLKRQIRAILAKKEALIAPGFDVTILTRPSAVGKASAELESQLDRVLKKARILA